MSAAIKPDSKHRNEIIDSVQAEINLCFTCGTCLAGCPINITTNRLQPLKIVRMANFGLLDELVRLPEIFYCLSCNQCIRECPMTVKPATLIEYLKREAVNRGVISEAQLEKHGQFYKSFHRARWHLALAMQKSSEDPEIESNWAGWLETKVPNGNENLKLDDLVPDAAFKNASGSYMGESTELTACFTCSGCTSVCPVFEQRYIFDPLTIFRMAGLGLKDELLNSPSIWLCIFCQNCTEACTQSVIGHKVMLALQDEAMKQGFLPPDFRGRWMEAHARLYQKYLEEIDSILAS